MKRPTLGSTAATRAADNKFLDEVVTPLFPDGLTLIKADGQFRGANGQTIKEDSFVLVLLYPLEGGPCSSSWLMGRLPRSFT